MNRYDFQRISMLRAKEARVLLDNGYYSGAYYLLGYAVECAFKACIARMTKKYDFPPKEINQIYTHKLDTLLKSSGLKHKLEKEIIDNRYLEANWSIVKDWSEQSRYSNYIDELTIRDFYSAVMARKNGVLAWLKKYW